MGMAPQLYTEVVTAAFANYTWSVWESSHTLSFTAALAIHTLGSTFPGSVHITDPCYTTHCAVAVIVTSSFTVIKQVLS